MNLGSSHGFTLFLPNSHSPSHPPRILKAQFKVTGLPDTSQTTLRLHRSKSLLSSLRLSISNIYSLHLSTPVPILPSIPHFSGQSSIHPVMQVVPVMFIPTTVTSSTSSPLPLSYWMINMVKPLSLKKEGRGDGREERRKKGKKVRTTTTRKYNFLPLQPLSLGNNVFHILQGDCNTSNWNVSLRG